MAIATYTALKAALAAPRWQVTTTKSTPSTANSDRIVSLWGQSPNAGATPATAATCTKATVGALVNLPPVGSGKVLRPLRLGCSTPGQSSVARPSMLILDRLSHQGGLSGTVTTEQTTNLPTAALPRYTTGAGVMAFLEVYGAIGSTGTTVTINYTNSAGTAGRTSEARAFGGTPRDPSVIVPIPLADGDLGVRSVEGVTVLASTATAGNFGVVLARPLYVIPCDDGVRRSEIIPALGGAAARAAVYDDACLWVVALLAAAATGLPAQSFDFAWYEDTE